MDNRPVPAAAGETSPPVQPAPVVPGTAWPPRRVIMATLAVLAVLLAFWLAYRFHEVWMSLFAAIVLSIAIRPLVDWLQRRGLPRSVSTALIMLLLIVFVVAVILLFAPLISEQGARISRTLIGYYRSLVDALRLSESYVIRRLALQLPLVMAAPPDVAAPVDEETILLSQINNLVGFVSVFLRTILAGFAILLMTYYWTLESDFTQRSLLILLPSRQRDEAREFIGEVEDKLGAYLRGLLVLCAVVGGLSLVAYLVIGMPQALLLALMAGLLEAVPLIGPILGALPAILLALALEPSKVIWVVVATIVIQQAENNLLVPRVMNRAVGVNPVVSLIALAALGSLFGIGGALLAIPLAVILQLALNKFVFAPEPDHAGTIPGRSSVSLLRYEAQNLIQDIHKHVREKETEVGSFNDRVEDTIEAVVQDIDSILAQYEEDGSTNGAEAGSGVEASGGAKPGQGAAR